MFKSIVEQLDFKDRKSLDILEAELERRKIYVWKTKSGDLIKVKDMSNEHLENAIRQLRRHWEEVDYIRENIEGCMDLMDYYD